MAEPSMSSNNPFRRKHVMPSAAAAATTPTAAAAADAAALLLSGADALFPDAKPLPGSPGDDDAALLHPTGDEFREQLRALPKSAEAPPSTTFIKPKVVKKVRVLSPPPSSPSPDSANVELETRFPASGPDMDALITATTAAAAATTTLPAASLASTALFAGLSPPADEPRYDEYSSESEDVEDEAAAPLRGRGANVGLQRPAANPFQKTGGDTEASNGTATVAAAAVAGTSTPTAGKGSLDVDAFRRLLLTGQAGNGDAGDAPPVSTLESAHTSAQASPRTSREISEDDRAGLVQGLQANSSKRHSLRPKPPPPSSRHGKLISSGGSKPAAPTEASKPPAENIFEQEDAEVGLDGDADEDNLDETVPVARPPTPPNASHTALTTTSLSAIPTRKPVPPPRRQTAHGRTDSRADSRAGGHERVSSLQSIGSAAGDRGRERSPPASRRSSAESARSRSSSMRAAAHVPAPPPPRRPNHASRSSNLFISPIAMSFASAASSPSDGHVQTHLNVSESATAKPVTPMMKLAKPPPPPARGISVRKKEGRSGVDAVLRRPLPHGHQQPPPPPPRARGSSRGSMDTPSTPPATSGAATPRKVSYDQADRLAVEDGQNSSSANTILADLDALQREVDALRGQYGK